MILQLLKRFYLTLIGVMVGAVGGYLYWMYVGCNSGACLITSSPVMSTLWGAAIGGLLFDMFKNNEKEKRK
jgi:hypothetical protein